MFLQILECIHSRLKKFFEALRKQAGLTQEQTTAELQLLGIHISREILSQIERGRCNIRISVFFALKSCVYLFPQPALFEYKTSFPF